MTIYVRLPIDPKLGAGADARLTKLWVDAARVTRELQDTVNASVGTGGEITPQQTGAAIYSGAGSPEAAVTAAIGSIYMRTDGGAGTCVYVKESGTGDTGWVAK